MDKMPVITPAMIDAQYDAILENSPGSVIVTVHRMVCWAVAHHQNYAWALEEDNARLRRMIAEMVDIKAGG